MTEETENLLKDLSPKEHDVIVLLFGLDGGYRKSPEEIAALYCITTETVLQIAQEALGKILATAEELMAIGEKEMEETDARIKTEAKNSPKKSQGVADEDLEVISAYFYETFGK